MTRGNPSPSTRRVAPGAGAIPSGDAIRSTRLRGGRPALSPSGYSAGRWPVLRPGRLDRAGTTRDARIIGTTRRRRRRPPRSRGTESSGWNTGDFRPAQQSETTTLSTTARSVNIAAIDVASSLHVGQIDPSLRRHTSRIDLIDDSDQLLDLQRLREEIVHADRRGRGRASRRRNRPRCRRSAARCPSDFLDGTVASPPVRP